MHPPLPVLHHGPVQALVLLRDHHGPQLVFLLFQQLFCLLHVLLLRLAGDDAHFLLTTFLLLLLLLAVFLVFVVFFFFFRLFLLLSLAFEVLLLLLLSLLLLAHVLLLGRNVVAHPPLGDEGREVGRQHRADEVVLDREALPAVDAVEDPLRLEVVAAYVLLVHLCTITDLMGDLVAVLFEGGSRRCGRVPGDLPSASPDHEDDGLPGHLPAQEELVSVEERLQLPLLRRLLLGRLSLLRVLVDHGDVVDLGLVVRALQVGHRPHQRLVEGRHAVLKLLVVVALFFCSGRRG